MQADCAESPVKLLNTVLAIMVPDPQAFGWLLPEKVAAVAIAAASTMHRDVLPAPPGAIVALTVRR